MKPIKHQPSKMLVQVHVASRTVTNLLHIFEADIIVPRFAAFYQLSDLSQIKFPTNQYGHGCIFVIKDSIDRFISYFQNSFIVNTKISIYQDKMKVGFISVTNVSSSLNSKQSQQQGQLLLQQRQSRHSSMNINQFNNHINEEEMMLFFTIVRFQEGGQTFTRVKIQAASLELVGEIVQDMCKYFNWQELESEADFPAEYHAFDQVIFI
jgi:hypothetical protein